ncbi:MAG: hypothetical protein ABIR77_01435 [Sphingomicrobium sp.]
MISRFALCAALAAMPLAPLSAQSMANMPGMSMPMTAKNTPLKKVAPKRVAKKVAASPKPHRAPHVIPGLTRDPRSSAHHHPKESRSRVKPGMTSTVPTSAMHPAMPGMDPVMPGMEMSAPAKPAAASEAMDPNMPGMAHDAHSASADPMAAMPGMAHGGHAMAMTGALGTYPMEREASGTAWQPDASQHQGVMKQVGGWMLMGHATLNLVGDTQGGPRGDDKAFVSGMVMGMAQHPLGKGKLQFKAMLSPDPLMGKAGYPLLLASGETADGVTRLVDRQHPHDLFMELSASVSQPIGKNASLFLYGGLPGEPAFGPPAFMHREAILDSPEAPITHHWLDSTHISFGVLTAGLIVGRAKVEVSRFNAREPDQYRYNIETGPLDSTAVRLSWNPTANWALQGSWAKFKDAEQLEPGVDQKRLSASILYAAEIAPGYKLATTLAWGRKTIEGESDDALAAEASVKHKGWTMFGRGEVTENRELIATLDHGPSYRVGKASLGVIRDVRLAEHVSVGVGGLVSVNFVPDALAPLYGGHNPKGAMAFLRFRID